MAATVAQFLPRAPSMNSEACRWGPPVRVTEVGRRALSYTPLANAASRWERVFMMSKPENSIMKVMTRKVLNSNHLRRMEMHHQDSEGCHSGTFSFLLSSTL